MDSAPLVSGPDAPAGSSSLAPRGDFPILDTVSYLNAASVALTPVPVQRQAQAFDREIAGQGTVGFDDAAEARVYEGARDSVARLLSTSPHNIAIMTSATEAIAQVAHWIRPGRGQNVVTTAIEFPSVTYPWLRLSRDTGAEVRMAEPRTPGELTFTDVAELVDDRTAAVCVSHVQYATGARLDPAALADVAHRHGAVLILDASQSAGAVPIDVEGTDQDVVIGSAYKWLCGSFGAGFCYMAPRIWQRFEPPFVGPRSTRHPSSFTATAITLADSARRMEYSTVAYGAGLAMAASIEYLLAFGVGRLFAHTQALGTRLIDGLERIGAHIVTPKEPEHRAGIVCGAFAGRDAGALVDALAAERVITSPRLGAIRFSPHLYNNATDIDRALDVLGHIVRRVGVGS